MRKRDSPKNGWDTGVSVPGALKLDHLQQVFPLARRPFLERDRLLVYCLTPGIAPNLQESKGIGSGIENSLCTRLNVTWLLANCERFGDGDKRQLDLATGEITHQVVKRVGQAMSVVRGTAAASNTDDECHKIQRPETELWGYERSVNLQKDNLNAQAIHDTVYNCATAPGISRRWRIWAGGAARDQLKTR